MAVDAAALGSYAHRLRWKWTNLASASRILAALHQLARPAGRHVDDILDTGRHAQAVIHTDQPPLAVVNQVGMPRLALPTLVSYPGSHAFRDHGPGLVWDTTTRRLREPRADERERAMGFSYRHNSCTYAHRVTAMSNSWASYGPHLYGLVLGCVLSISTVQHQWP